VSAGRPGDGVVEWPVLRLHPAVGGWALCDYRQPRPNMVAVLERDEVFELNEAIATAMQLCWRKGDELVAFMFRDVALKTTPGKAAALALDVAAAAQRLWQYRLDQVREGGS
jgi:hypothetical protein